MTKGLGQVEERRQQMSGLLTWQCLWHEALALVLGRDVCASLRSFNSDIRICSVLDGRK